MLEPQRIEELICMVSAMDRQALIDRCTHFHGLFPVDFTPDFLQQLPLDRLRHIFVALCLHNDHLPHLELPAAVA